MRSPAQFDPRLSEYAPDSSMNHSVSQPSPVTAAKPPPLSFLKLAGPGLVVAATGIGSGDVVSATVGGARYGVVLLWAIARRRVLQVRAERGNRAVATGDRPDGG